MRMITVQNWPASMEQRLLNSEEYSDVLPASVWSEGEGEGWTVRLTSDDEAACVAINEMLQECGAEPFWEAAPHG